MKKFLLGLLGICCGATLLGATGSTTPQGWYDDFEEARIKAKEQNRPILLLLTGSDWCPFCQHLKKEALDKDDFKKYAKDRLILVYADSPRYEELSRKLVTQNRELARRFGVRGYPTTIILAPDGNRELGRIGGFVNAYLDRVKDITARR